MSVFTRAYLSIDSNSPVDAFARIRMSNPQTLFDSKQLFDNLPLFYDDQEVSGSNTTSLHDYLRASTTIGVTPLNAGKRVRQTRQRWNYSPGKSQLVIMTFVMDNNISGVIKEVGLFDDDNGLFFRMNGTSPELVVRGNMTGTPVETVIPQSDWILDKVDGTGISGVTLDFEKAHIFFIDFEWLGVGTVRYGFFYNGQPIYVHAEHHANSITSVYMSTPNLPIRYSIENDGTGAQISKLEHICTTVISEGGYQTGGVNRSVSRDIDAFSTNNNTDIYPIIRIRLKTTHIGASINLINTSILVTSLATNFRHIIYWNPTFLLDTGLWVALDNSAIEYNVTSQRTSTITGGTIIYSAYGTNDTPIYDLNIDSPLRLGSSIDGTRDEIVLAVQNTKNGIEDYLGSINFKELL